MNKRDTTALQIRLSNVLYDYVQEEANRLGIAKNAVIAQIIDRDRKSQILSGTSIEPYSRS